MANLRNIKLLKNKWQWTMYLFFASFSFFIIYNLYNPDLLYLKLQPFFAFDSNFYNFHFQFRQGYISLISQFLLQFLYYPFIGSLILTILLLLLAMVFRKVFQKTIEAGFEGIEFSVPVFVLWQLKSYTSGLESLVILFLSGILYIGAASLQNNLYLRGIYQLLTIYLLFTVFGAPLTLFLVLLYFLHEFVYGKSRNERMLSLIILVFYGVLAFVFSGFQMLKIQFKYFIVPGTDNPFPGLWLFILFIVMAFLPGRFPFSFLSGIKLFKRKLFASSWFFPLLLLLFCSIGFKYIFINSEKFKTEIDYFVTNNKWDKVLLLKNKVGPQDRLARFQMNRALYETGQMSENLFSIPQNWGEYGLFLNKEYSMECTPYSSDLFYDLGFIKASKYWMIEYQTYAPYSPFTLERLAISSLLLGEFSTAKKYYTITGKSMIYRASTHISLERLKKDPDSLLKEYYSKNMAILKEENIINIKEPDKDLINILKVNRKNKMAFEYLMSYYILRNDLNNFYRFIPLVKSSGYYSKMPTSYEEVLLMYYQKTKQPENSWEYAISKNSIERFREFKRVAAASASNKSQQKEILKPMFKNTFWYYVYFDSPSVSGNKISFK